MIVFIAVVGSLTCLASIARLLVAIADYRRRWRPCPEVEVVPHDFQIYPDGSWSRPSGWANRTGQHG